jgi:hypothetical protein
MVIAQRVGVAEERFDAEHVLAGRGIADILDGRGTQATFGELGKETPGGHLEVALGVRRVEGPQPGSDQRLVGFGAGRLNELDGQIGRQLGRHENPCFASSIIF